MSGTIAVGSSAASGRNNNIQVAFRNCAPFTNCISKISNTQIDNAKDIHVVMPMYNVIEHSNNYSKTSESLRQYYRDQPVLINVGALADFPDASFNSA